MIPRPAGEALTAPAAGAIGLVLVRRNADRVLAGLTGLDGGWTPGRLRLVDLGGLDRGLAVRLGDDRAILMPHGGTAVVAAIRARVNELAASSPGSGAPAPIADDVADLAAWPEAAGDPILAASLDLMAAAASPLAGGLLLRAAEDWRRRDPLSPWTQADAERSRRLDHLLVPPVVVLCGRPNIGKSTLANALAGRTVAVVADVAGTTRDAPRVRLDLAGLVVRWHDAPGLRRTDDPLERAAIDRVADLVSGADLVIAAADAAHDWPDLERPADLRVALRSDLGPRPGADVSVSATTGDGLVDLAELIRDRLVPPEDRAATAPWDAGGVLRSVANAASASAQKPIDEMPQST